MDRGAWWATVHGVTKNWTRLSDEHSHFLLKSNWGWGTMNGGLPHCTPTAAQRLSRKNERTCPSDWQQLASGQVERLPQRQPAPVPPQLGSLRASVPARPSAPAAREPAGRGTGPAQPASRSPSPGLLRLTSRLPLFASLELQFVCDSRINSCWLGRGLVIPTPRPTGL